MSELTAVDIAKLCDDWCSASTSDDGDMDIGPHTDKYGLLENGVVFPELDHEALCAALIGLSKTLLRPKLSSVIREDHVFLWSWCGELLLNGASPQFSPDQHEIKSLYETAVHAALAHCRKPVAPKKEREARHKKATADYERIAKIAPGDRTPSEWRRITEAQQVIMWPQMDVATGADAVQPHHATQLLKNAGLVLAYLSFPLLEAVLKRACASFVGFDGQVLSSFTVTPKEGEKRSYAPEGRRRCSSLRDLLLLHHTLVAEPELRSALDRFRNHIQSLDGSKDPFDLIYSWRNQSLHGETNFRTIGETMLNLSLLISLFDIKKDFEQYRDSVFAICRTDAERTSRPPWSFYPPY